MQSVGIACLLFAMLFGPAAHATPTAATAAIPPVVWELTALTGPDGGSVAIDDPSHYTVQFLADGSLVAQFDCNHGGGSYTAVDGALQIFGLRSTLMGCEAGSQGSNFSFVLEKAMAFAFDPDGDLLLSGDAGSLRLRPALAGVRWDWQAFEDGDGAIVRPDHPDRYMVEFLPDGKLAIQADCNRGVGTYTTDGPTIDLQIGGVTRALCPEGSLMDRFLRDLDAANSHVFRAGHLFLALPFDSGILEFAPMPVPPAEVTPAAG
ncbi:MAG TPA: META domain-containing protein [Thermomicrobiales bacterium]|jgi:heat shock protein HslJ|nr:META domain-containing protein [Thermomicrobiales bacterium]